MGRTGVVRRVAAVVGGVVVVMGAWCCNGDPTGPRMAWGYVPASASDGGGASLQEPGTTQATLRVTPTAPAPVPKRGSALRRSLK